MKVKNSKLTKTKLLDIDIQRKRTPIMKTESELGDESQVLFFQAHEVKQPFKSARLEVTPARNLVRVRFFRASETEEYPWNKTPIVVTHLYAQHKYVIPRKTKKQQLNITKELIIYCPALRLQKTIPSYTKKIGARVPSSNAKPKRLKTLKGGIGRKDSNE